jgi:diguanylate cyclase (GGDEF)-like protein
MSEISGNKQRLLIVDDSKVIRVTARKILQKHFETVEAVDGNNAWDILTSQEPFSLIVSDLTMPNMDGFALLEKIRGSHLPHVRNIPVIIITGANDSETTMQRATAAGATDFIGKPFDSVHLLARTQAHAASYAANATLTEEKISLEDRSQTDPLTGLANDMAFREQGRAQLAYAIRHDAALALASLEIDSFDELVRMHDNDAGELVIKSVGSALAANIRKEDVAARTGTARFALLLPGMDVSGVSRLSERITGDVGKHAVIVGGKQVRFTVSIGIAAPDIRPDTSFEELLGAADGSLRQAMADGGNRVMPEDSYPEVPEADSDWTLEPFENRETHHAPAQDESLPEIEDLQIETVEPLAAPDAEPAVDFDEIMLDGEPQPDHTVEPAATTRPDTLPATDTATHDVEETIVITSPYSLFDLDEVELDIPAEAMDAPEGVADTAVPDSGRAAETMQSSARETALPALTDDEGDTDLTTTRPGVLRRLLGALFGRRD